MQMTTMAAERQAQIILAAMVCGRFMSRMLVSSADLSHISRRGVGAGTIFIALEVGIMIGSLSTLITYDNTADSIAGVFFWGMVMSILALIYLLWHKLNRQSEF
jgi:predicted MFS family arabinose efflux permease